MIKILPFIVMLLISINGYSQDHQHSDSASIEDMEFVDSKGIKLKYKILKPQILGKGTPLVLGFHGAGTRAHYDKITKNTGVATFKDSISQYPCIMIIPHCPEGHRWVEVPWGAKKHRFPSKPSQYLAATFELLDSVVKQYNVDTKRLYITGLSMGGFGVWDAIVRRPNTFAAAIPVCGGAPHKKAKIIAHMPIWVFHGGADDVVLTSRSDNMVNALKKTGAKKVKYTKYPNVGHPSWKKAYKEPQLLSWLFSQKLSK